MASGKKYLNAKTGQGPFYQKKDKSLPNILFISLDMVPPEFYRTRANQTQSGQTSPVNSPNIDSLKEEGLFFVNAFSASPLCAPSRASYLTGRFSYITGNEERSHNGESVHLREHDIIFPEYLKAGGYHVRQVGKCHVGAKKFIQIFSENASPWDRWSPPWFDDAEYLEFLRRKGLKGFTFDREIYGQNPARNGKGNFYGGWISPQAGKPFPMEAAYPGFLVNKAISYLESWTQEKGPFYLQLDFFGPHQPFAIPGGMELREEQLRKELELPSTYMEIEKNNFTAPWEEPRVYRLYRKNWGLYQRTSLLDYMAANLLQYELLDRYLGNIVHYLKQRDLYDQTCIFFLADHGEMNGEFALIDKGVYLHPKVVRVPLIIKPPTGLVPGADRAGLQGSQIETPVSLLDLSPTILELAGIECEDRQDGINLFAFPDTNKRAEDKPILFEAGSHIVPNPCVGIVFSSGSDQRNYLYSYNLTDQIDELYPLNTDFEYRNCALDPQAKDVYQDAIIKMDKVLAEDPRWFGYSQCFRLENAERLPFELGDRQLFTEY